MPFPPAALIHAALALASQPDTRVRAERPTADAAYTGDVLLVRGSPGGSDALHLGNLDATIDIPLSTVSRRLRGGTLFLYAQANYGRSASTAAGDAQGVSNIEAAPATRLYEAWIQQRIGSRVSLLVGRYDLNSEFDYSRTGEVFVHSSHGIGAEYGLSGRNGPSVYPATGLGARMRGRVSSSAFLQLALLDGGPSDKAFPDRLSRDDLLLAAEVQVLGLRAGDAASPAARPVRHAPTVFHRACGIRTVAPILG